MSLSDRVRPVYNKLRPMLPRKIGMVNGVAARLPRWFDLTDVYPEDLLIDAIREKVRFDDTVVIVGGGHGASSVAAANQVGPNGSVLVFEAAIEQVHLVAETIQFNQVHDRAHVEHAVVGPAIDVWGSTGTAPRLDPCELPDCDVLVLDCEGAEVAILEGIAQQPRTIVVEYHRDKGAPFHEVKRVLRRRGYRSREFGVEDQEQGIGVVVTEGGRDE